MTPDVANVAHKASPVSYCFICKNGLAEPNLSINIDGRALVCIYTHHEEPGGHRRPRG
jgi:hypothetical protein